MMLIHKVLDCVQVAISTDQREWSVSSLVEYTCEWRLVLFKNNWCSQLQSTRLVTPHSLWPVLIPI